MFRKLTVRNFQCHSKFIIRFDPHVTTIAGRNDSGKSAILRGIRLVTRNRGGRSCIKRGQKFSSVILTVEGHQIERRIGTDNKYRFNGEVYRAFRANVPDSIQKILRLEDINFQTQHSPYFWFSLTPGQVARELNKLVDLDAIDRVQSEVNRHLRDKKAELEVCKKRLKESRETVRRLRWVIRLGVKLDKLEKLGQYRLKSHILARLRDTIGLAVVQRATHRNAIHAGLAGLAAMRLAGLVRRGAGRAGRLAGLAGGMLAANRWASKKIPELPELPDLDPPRIDRLCNLIKSLESQEKELCLAQKRLRKREKRLEEKLGGRCPTCGGLLTDQTLL